MENPPRSGLSPEEIDGALQLILAEGRVVALFMRRDTASMLPTLQPGEKVAVRRAGDLLERGDLLLFRGGDDRVVHRYLGRATTPQGEPCLRTRGDNNPTLDAPLDPARVLGRVVAVERDGEWWDLDSPAARLYGLGAALHDLFWAVAVHAAGRLDALRGRAGGGLRERIADWDRRLLSAAHRLFGHLARRRSAPEGLAASRPPGPGPGGAGGD